MSGLSSSRTSARFSMSLFRRAHDGAPLSGRREYAPAQPVQAGGKDRASRRSARRRPRGKPPAARQRQRADAGLASHRSAPLPEPLRQAARAQDGALGARGKGLALRAGWRLGCARVVRRARRGRRRSRGRRGGGRARRRHAPPRRASAHPADRRRRTAVPPPAGEPGALVRSRLRGRREFLPECYRGARRSHSLPASAPRRRTRRKVRVARGAGNRPQPVG